MTSHRKVSRRFAFFGMLTTAACCAAIGGCQRASAPPPGLAPTSANSPPAAAPTPRLLVPAAWKQSLEQSPGAIVLDVRTPSEFQEGHVKGATLIPHTEIADQKAKLPANKTQPIFVYCKSGGRSAAAAETLTALGYSNVTDLDGGIRAWKAAQLPIDK